MYSAGHIVWAPDAYRDDPELRLGNMRPWAILNNDGFPGHGDQFLCCALTSGAGTGDSFVEVQLAEGAMGKRSFMDTETVVTIKRSWITRKTGRIHRDAVQRARARVKSYL